MRLTLPVLAAATALVATVWLKLDRDLDRALTGLALDDDGPQH